MEGMEEIQNKIQKKKQSKWLLIVVIIGSMLLIFTGIAIGYLITDKGCMGNPLIFGIRQINKLNKDDYECSCHSRINFGSFSFDSEKMQDNNLIP